MSNHGWIGVDLDGTLAIYDGWKGVDHIGPPVEKMMTRVKGWLAEGREVKIFTARVSGRDAEEAKVAIHDWLEKHGLPRLDVTCMKDFRMVELWDDRAIGVIENMGLVR